MKTGTIGILPWSPATPNPYQKLSANSIEQLGLSVIGCKYNPLLPLTSTVYQHKNLDGLLLDWVHSFYTSKSTTITMLKSAFGAIDISISRNRNFPIVWNIHNLHRHDQVHKKIENKCLRYLAKHVDGIRVFHSGFEETIRYQLDIPQRIPAVAIPQPNYVDHYEKYPFIDYRNEWCLPDDHLIMLVFGSIRAGKGIEQFLETYVKIPKKNMTLVIAGNATEPLLNDRILKFADNNDVRLMLRHINDFEVSSIFKAVDVVVLPYEHILNSGVAALAMGFEKPILANDNDSFRTSLHSDFTFFCKLFQPDSLAETLNEMNCSDLKDMGKKAKSESDEKFDNLLNTKRLLQFVSELRN